MAHNNPSSIKGSQSNWIDTLLKTLYMTKTVWTVASLSFMLKKDQKSVTLLLAQLKDLKVVKVTNTGYKIAKDVSEQDLLVHSNLLQQ